LVSKSWTNPSRRHLFKEVNVSEKFLPSWLNRISPANHQLLQHIQVLSYVTSTQNLRNGGPPKYSINVLQDYLPSFHQLQHLSLFSMHIPSDVSLKLEIFSAFQSTLSRLSLKHCDVTISALITLINYFPNLDHLDLSSLRQGTGGKPTPPLSRPRMSRLHLSELRPEASGILNQLSELGPVFDEVQVVNGRLPARLPALTRIANTVGERVKRLGLLQTSRVYHQGAWSALLAPCRELREFELVVTHPGNKETEIISSITSTSIRKVSLVYRWQIWGPSWRDFNWGVFNEPLCRLVDRLGPRHELEVEILIVDMGGERVYKDIDPGVIVGSLAAFREKGRIRLVYTGPDGRAHVVYPCSSNPSASVC